MCLIILLRSTLLRRQTSNSKIPRSSTFDSPVEPLVSFGGREASEGCEANSTCISVPSSSTMDHRSNRKSRRHTITSSVRQSLRPLVLHHSARQTCRIEPPLPAIPSNSFDEMLNSDLTIRIHSTPDEPMQDFIKVYENGSLKLENISAQDFNTTQLPQENEVEPMNGLITSPSSSDHGTCSSSSVLSLKDLSY
ncbi:hypothetical protein CROQUDRAFT_667365 [Cronartium quercuum f. sp. fusiforme G11]|uniref:Uncharacterized protein n=1 Tax=Cronartium quercuum f. sp. fusiforme G11 TaxID=708437 RepID=A0A9P6NY85_9BASI|nr:hypothetical protein CROQUDRAFT_667365 [Cronartium quercuum f. sp. fusiforme G11]